MFNKFGFLLIGIFILFSGAIYANEDADLLPIKEQLRDGALCSVAAENASNEFGVDADLLQAVAVVESGKWNNLQNRHVAWPWTVNVAGKGYYFDSQEDAVKAVRKFQAQGITSIDVGCMQINLKYHGAAFSSVEAAMNPENNVKYGAKFLRTLYMKNGNNWRKAAERYHSASHAAGAAYAKRLENRFEEFKVAGLAKNVKLFK